MSKLKIYRTSLTLSRIILVFFTAMLIIVLPQLNIQAYVLPTITSKLIYFLYGIIILLGLYVLTIIFSKTISLSFSKIDIALFALVIYITVNRYFIQSNWGFSIRYIELLGLIFLYIVLRFISLKNYIWVLLAIIISGIAQAVYGNLQLLGYYPSNHPGFKMTGSFFNPGPYAGFLVSVWPVALGMYLFKANIANQVYLPNKNNFKFLNKAIKYTFEYIPLLALISIAIVFPSLQSRASWIAAIVSSGVLVELRFHFLKNIFKKVTVPFQKTALILLAILILSIGLIGLYHYKKASSDGRVFIWKVSTEMIIDAPAFGVGFDRFKSQYMNYQANYFAKNGETPEALVADNVYYVFNDWLQFVAENGLLGFLLLLIVLFVLFQVKQNQINGVEFYIAKTVFLTIGVFAFFSYPMQILPIKIVLITALSLLSCLNSGFYKLKLLQNTVYNVCKISLTVLAIIIITKVNLYVSKLDKGFKTWQVASDPFLDYVTALKEYEIAYPIFKNQGDFLMSYGKTLSLAEKNTKAIAILQEAKQHLNTTIIETALGDAYKGIKEFKKAEEAYQQAYDMNPSRFYPIYLLAKLYNENNNRKKAVLMANCILKKEVKIPSTAIKEMREEMKKIIIKYKNI